MICHIILLQAITVVRLHPGLNCVGLVQLSAASSLQVLVSALSIWGEQGFGAVLLDLALTVLLYTVATSLQVLDITCAGRGGEREGG